MNHYKKSPRYTRVARVDAAPEDPRYRKKAPSTRFCARCRKYTTFRFEPTFGHSECSECRGRASFETEEKFDAFIAQARS